MFPFCFVLQNSRFLSICSPFLSFFQQLGNKAWTLKLDWKGKDEFNAAEEHEWQGAGLARTAEGLTFLQVYDAGHMVSMKDNGKMKCNSWHSHLHLCSVQVPADQPKVALDMIKNFVDGGSF